MSSDLLLRWRLAVAAQDFVRLTKWEDRGYYAMKATTERNQRQLHRLTRRAEEALSQPAAAVLAAASKAMGLADLTADSDGGAVPLHKGAAATATRVHDHPTRAGQQPEGASAGPLRVGRRAAAATARFGMPSALTPAQVCSGQMPLSSITVDVGAAWQLLMPSVALKWVLHVPSDVPAQGRLGQRAHQHR